MILVENSSAQPDLIPPMGTNLPDCHTGHSVAGPGQWDHGTVARRWAIVSTSPAAATRYSGVLLLHLPLVYITMYAANCTEVIVLPATVGYMFNHQCKLPVHRCPDTVVLSTIT